MADQYNASRFAFRADRIAKGLCRDCGKVPPLSERVVCHDCMKTRTRRGNAFKDARQQKGFCTKCGAFKGEDRVIYRYCLRCSTIQVELARQNRKRNKEFIVNYFGGKCIVCNENNICCLSLDHLDGDGNLDKKSINGEKQISAAWYAKLYLLIKAGKELPRRLQLLCFNCHAKKDLQSWWYNGNNS